MLCWKLVLSGCLLISMFFVMILIEICCVSIFKRVVLLVLFIFMSVVRVLGLIYLVIWFRSCFDFFLIFMLYMMFFYVKMFCWVGIVLIFVFLVLLLICVFIVGCFMFLLCCVLFFWRLGGI